MFNEFAPEGRAAIRIQIELLVDNTTLQLSTGGGHGPHEGAGEKCIFWLIHMWIAELHSGYIQPLAYCIAKIGAADIGCADECSALCHAWSAWGSVGIFVVSERFLPIYVEMIETIFDIGSGMIVIRKTMASTIVCVAILFGSFSAAGASSQAAPTEYARSTVDVLNVRAEPSLTAKIVSKIGKSRKYAVLDKQTEWTKIRLADDTEGWVFGQYIKYEDSESPKTTEKKAVEVAQLKQATTVKIIDVTNLRSGPGTDYAIIGKSKPGTTYPISGTEGEWYKVTLPNKGKAYIASWVVETDFLSRNAALTTPANSNNESATPTVFIYHSHNRESWNHVMLEKQGSSPSDDKVNITLVGDRFAQLLQDQGIPALTAEEDFAETLKRDNLDYSQSYAVSRQAVDKAREAYPSIRYFFDIHRDANIAREKTTVTIDGAVYARILFVIGTAHERYEENEAFAEALNKLLNDRYPGLSRGILTKSAHQGNGEYNQSISPGSLLVEIGSVNNTVQESLRTAEALADVFAHYMGE